MKSFVLFLSVVIAGMNLPTTTTLAQLSKPEHLNTSAKMDVNGGTAAYVKSQFDVWVPASPEGAPAGDHPFLLQIQLRTKEINLDADPPITEEEWTGWAEQIVRNDNGFATSKQVDFKWTFSTVCPQGTWPDAQVLPVWNIPAQAAIANNYKARIRIAFATQDLDAPSGYVLENDWHMSEWETFLFDVKGYGASAINSWWSWQPIGD